MEQTLAIKYNPITKTLAIVENEFTTFEAFGILEAAKQMIAKGWLEDES